MTDGRLGQCDGSSRVRHRQQKTSAVLAASSASCDFSPGRCQDMEIAYLCRSVAHLFASQYIEQWPVDVVVAATDLVLVEKPAVHQLLQIFGCRYPRYTQIALNKADLGIGIAEQVVEQILAVKRVPLT